LPLGSEVPFGTLLTKFGLLTNRSNYRKGTNLTFVRVVGPRGRFPLCPTPIPTCRFSEEEK
jgi:hypothetical protein